MKGLGYAYAKSGRTRETNEVIKQLDNLQQNAYVSPFYYATIYTGMDELDKAFEFLEKAYQDRSRSLAWFKVAREFRHLHGDPRFQDLVQRIGIPA